MAQKPKFNLTFICELVEIGSDCFIGHGVVFINDLFSSGGPAQGDKTMWKKTSIGNKVSIGSNATILPVNIASNVVIGAGSVVTKDINEPGIYCGNPAKKFEINYESSLSKSLFTISFNKNDIDACISNVINNFLLL